MTLEIVLTQADLNGREYSIREKLNGKRFGTEEEIKRYCRDNDPQALFQVLKNFFLVQYVSHPKLEDKTDSLSALPLATYFASQVASRQLNYSDSAVSYFFNNKKVNFNHSYTEISGDMIELYLAALRECSQSEKIETITDAFLNWSRDSAITHISQLDNLDDFKDINFALAGKKYVLDMNKGEKSVNAVDISSYVLPNPAGETGTKKEDLFIYGHEHVKKEFEKLAIIVKNKDYFCQRHDQKDLFRNYLLVGPPGTGKTTLVRNLAQKTGLAFHHKACAELGSEFFSKSSRNIHDEYRKAAAVMAREKVPGVILFFDEFDHIAKVRGYSNSGEADNCITTLNENLDGGSRVPGIITVGATNRGNLIDPAIRSRMRELYVGYPETDEGVIGIHQTIIKKKEGHSRQKMFDQLDYGQILAFSRADERYKSGRVINNILTDAALDKDIEMVEMVGKNQKNVPRPVSTSKLVSTTDVIAKYQAYDLDREEKEKPILGGRTITR